MRKKKINNEMIFGGFILSIYIMWAVLWLLMNGFDYTPSSIISHELFKPFSHDYFLGTDINGRSLFKVLSVGLIYTVGISLLISSSACLIGIIIGYLSAIKIKFVSEIMDMFTNLIFIFPSILLAILVMSFSGQSFTGLVLCLIFTSWPGYARIARGETMRVLNLGYVESARAIGVSEFRLFYKSILPSIVPVISIHFVLGISGVIISEASLGFLGLGASEYSWGAILAMAKLVLLEAPHVVIVTSLLMTGLIISLNLFGDGLRDYLDPKLKGKGK
ncbi:ABC transporter permease [Halobacteriovorax sp. XZX-3]|uniref:ABC transporter permease n=2 Tax=unclassified Halobacteriovorax TaxID=2639665 RepID=UPI000CCFF651|nr:ABC transporter permease [Halobacteriovorax sp. DA5]POB12438.1 hypothetical protein C0Z22_15585 [Halobacteriovorax sp. DA5]